MSAPSIKSITETPLPGEVNPFDPLPRELVGAILDSIDTQEARLAAELAYKLFSSCAPRLFVELEEHWLPSFLEQSAPENEKIKAFYSSFKKRMLQLKVEFPSEEFLKGISRFSNKMLFYGGSIKHWLIYASHKDAEASYAAQDAVCMTIENFKRTLAFLNSAQSFPMSTNNVEFMMRCKIKELDDEENEEKQKQRTAEFEKARLEFANPADTAPRFIEGQRSVKARLEGEKKRLEEKQRDLRGPDGFNGTIHAAYQEMDQAKFSLLDAMRTAKEVVSIYFDDLSSLIHSNCSLYLAMHHPQLGNPTRTTEVLKAESALKQKVDAYEALKAELAHIAVYGPSGQIIGGRLIEIEAELQPDAIARRAREEITLRARFYEELNKDPQGGDPSRRLHEIIDNT